MTLRLLCLSLAALCAIGAGASTGDDLPSADALQAKIDAARGPQPKIERDVVAYAYGSATGRTVTLTDGDDSRTIDDDDGFHTERGIFHGEHWHENENGHVVIDLPDPEKAAKEPMTVSVKRVHAPFDAFAIERRNRRGFGTTTLVDPLTYDVVREETTAPNGRLTTTFRGFRSFDGRRLPTEWTIHDEQHALDVRSTRESYTTSGVTEADVAEPVIAHPLVEFPAGVDRVVLPSTFEPDGHIVVRLTIAGRGLDFLLDTGASSLTLDPGVASQLGLHVGQRRVSSENAGRFATGKTLVDAAQIGSLTLRHAVVDIVPLAFEFQSAKAVGLLGFDFLCELGLSIDYDRHEVVAQRFGTYAAPSDPRAIGLTVRFGNQVPLTSVSINSARADRIMIDTGGAGPFMLMDYFTRHNPDAIRNSDVLRSGRMTGAGGPFDVDVVKIRDFRVGNVDFKDFLGYRVASGASYAGNVDGIIAPTFLKFFNVVLDYPNGTVYLVPNASGRAEMRADS